jgi:hypothetical protein
MAPADTNRHFSFLRLGAQLALASLVCLSLTYLTVRLGLAVPLGLSLKYSYLTGPLVMTAVYYTISRYCRPPGTMGMLMVFMLCISLIVLLGVWRAGVSDGLMIGGLLPYSDASGYFSDALRLLHGWKFSVFSSRRPLFPAFLAGVLQMTDLDLRATLVLLTGIAITAICFAAREVQRALGLWPGALMLLSLFMFYRRYIGSTLTEHLGLAFGCLAFALIWRGMLIQQRGFVLLGLFILSLALNARAGTFLILPAILLWAVWAHREPNRPALWTLVGGSAAVLLGFAVNSVLLHAVSIPGAAYSNFSYVLYGLVFGGNWSLALQQHPELATLAPLEQANRVFTLAWEQIRMNPMTLAVGSVRAWRAFFLGRSGTWFSHILYLGPDWADLREMLLTQGVSALNFRRDLWVLLDVFARETWIITLNGLMIAGSVVLWRNRRTPFALLNIAAWTGILLSVPFVPPWDADNMRAYAATIPWVIALPALGLRLRHGEKGTWDQEGMKSPGLASTDLAVFTAILLGLQILGPLTLIAGGPPRWKMDPAISCGPNCRDTARAGLVYLDPRIAVRLTESAEEASTAGPANTVDVRNLRERKHIKDYPDLWQIWRELSRIPGGTTLALGFDLRRGEIVYIQSSSAGFPRSPGVASLCGQGVRSGWVEWLKTESLVACEGKGRLEEARGCPWLWSLTST